MTLLRRMHDLLTGVLGHDCAGKPLRKGDVVEPVPWLSDDEVSKSAQCQLTVLRSATLADALRYDMSSAELMLVNPDGIEIICRRSSFLRKVPPRELEAGWENVERLTGWAPSVVKESEVAA